MTCHIKFKKSLTFLCILLLTVMMLFESCGKQSDKPLKLGFIVKRPEEKWFQDEWKGAQHCAEKYGFELVRIGATDGEKTLAAIDNLGAQGAKGFVICTPDVRLGPGIMARANSYGMKVIAVDDMFIDAEGNPMNVPYLGMDAYEIGKTVGKSLYDEFMARKWDIEETAALAVSFDELETCLQRTTGATEVLIEAGFPADKIFDAPVKTSDVPGSFDISDVVITQHPYIKKWIIFGSNDEGVLGSVRALENRGFDTESVIGIGIGGSTARSEFEKEERTGFFATVFVNAYNEGYITAEMLYKWIKEGIEPPKVTKKSGQIVTKDTYIQIMREHNLSDNK